MQFLIRVNNTTTYLMIHEICGVSIHFVFPPSSFSSNERGEKTTSLTTRAICNFREFKASNFFFSYWNISSKSLLIGGKNFNFTYFSSRKDLSFSCYCGLSTCATTTANKNAFKMDLFCFYSLTHSLFLHIRFCCTFSLLLLL